MPINLNDYKKPKGQREQGTRESAALPSKLIKYLANTKELFLDRTGLINFSPSNDSLDLDHLSHSLIRTGKNQWNIIENDMKGEGGFGQVRSSHSKIILQNNTATIVPANDVVKMQQLATDSSRERQIENAKKEAANQKQHNVKVSTCFAVGDAIYTVTENCGTSLDQIMHSAEFANASFDERLTLVLGICNEIFLLQKNGQVHRDLKPANICRKEIHSRLSDSINYQTILIDFGLAEKYDSPGNFTLSGTVLYMAPEILNKQGTSYASDIYALAGIIGEIFNANIFLRKRQCKSIQALIKTPFYFEDLFTGIAIPSNVDEYLLADIKNFLEAMQQRDKDQRPSIDLIHKFFNSIGERRIQNTIFVREWKRMASNFAELAILYQEIGLESGELELKKVKAIVEQQAVADNENSLRSLQHSLVTIYQEIKKLSPPKTHFEVASCLVNENRTAQDYDQLMPFPSLDGVNNAITNTIESIKKFKSACLDTQNIFISNGNKFAGTNSSGILQIKAIFDSADSPFNKLEKIRAIAQKKLQPGFAYNFSNWRIPFFKKGRHKNVEELYKKLQNLNLANKTDCAIASLTEINDLITKTQEFAWIKNKPQR